MKHLTVKEKEIGAFEKMKNSTPVSSSEFHYKNVRAAPKLKKIILNVGTGSGLKKDKNKNQQKKYALVSKQLREKKRIFKEDRKIKRRN